MKYITILNILTEAPLMLLKIEETLTFKALCAVSPQPRLFSQGPYVGLAFQRWMLN